MLPLIDVVFLLLVFFIYAMLSMVVHHGLKVDLPSAGTAAMDRNAYISIVLDADNRILLDDQVVSMDEVAPLVRRLIEASPRPVFIDGDASTDLGLAISLLDTLKQSGIQEVSFSCKPSQP